MARRTESLALHARQDADRSGSLCGKFAQKMMQLSDVQGLAKADDLDFCWKVYAAIITNYYLPGPEIVHYGSGSTECARNRFSVATIPESVRRLLRKNRGKSYSLIYQIALGGDANGT